MIRILFFFPLVVLFAGVLQAQSPKREFRGVWVATVRHLDYPSRPTTDTESLKREYTDLLNRFRRLGFNAVVFQIRPAADAFYPTELAPWSADLTGRQGQAPAGGFDPMAFYVEEAHRLGMEFHAWLNPYRATLDLDTLKLSPRHVFHRRRNWVFRYGDRFYLNPALPEVREHLTEVVTEIVQRYDLDAIHFDDYFYPYKIAGEVLPDSLEFQRFGVGFGNIDDWRRGNTDALIQSIAQRIKLHRPHVRFGISPFGVWRNAERDSSGSATRAGVTTYDDLYADVLKWMRFGWIDYVVPQLYWSIGFAPADHQLLLDWWSRNRNNRHLYVGYAAYKVGSNPDSAWLRPQELPRQLDMGRQAGLAQGGIFFRAASLLANPLGIADSLERRYARPALLPAFPGPALSRMAPPQNLRAGSKRGEVTLSWSTSTGTGAQAPAYFVVYRFEGKQAGSLEDARAIVAITPIGLPGSQFFYTDRSVRRRGRYTYTVTPVDRYHQEGPAATPISLRAR